ncbi:alpha-L-rhamnosidase-related protein [Lactobacillus mulieris]|uniref:Alpha-rhamnosidase n=1 Tax=Lactobacillus mulieris TaxID=2508708 RepID=A0AAW5WXL1_9LACO|nr:alpha-rhamnosidase [Lactobacillus mulieris]MCZ3621679.1 alpha-rhamnosidase [Lactobacillus mulieris]MCZ3623045.1 alpha-rhamnosidase [Lactobacillus mulieris]MCZ3635686.1 alpha-rhamnosidase [Lactobacillus mulieris]MCZ3690085.1 alpha-rhamnosidase [Lactobacillus mulieris]MCZ3696023.1 alpha-rhamnosidase [Lactobacillus mulieris]
MSFKFQINTDIKFNRNKYLLAKADKYKPEIIHKTVFPKELVKLIKDKSQLDDVGIKKSNSIEQLTTMSFAKDDSFILDMGRHCVGKFQIHIEHVGSPMDAPLTLKIRFAEMPNEFKYNSDDYNGWLSKSWMQEELIHIDTLPVDLQLSRRYSFRYVEITVVDTSPKWSVQFSRPTVIAQSSVDKLKAIRPNFDDKELEQIYQVGLNTLHECMQDVFEDGPKRDRRLWLGDLRLQALANYTSFDNTNLVKRCLYLFAAMTAKDGRISANVFTNNEYIPDDTFMYDYGLFFISTLDDLLKHEFSQEILDDLYPIAKKQWEYDQKFITSEGKVILDEDYITFVDWSQDFDKTTSAQAITIYTLKQLINLAGLAKDSEKIRYQKQLEKLESYAKNKLFDKDKGFFISGPKKEINLASQAWMVLAHVLNDKENHLLMKKSKKELFPIKGIATPYMYHHVDQALFEAGLKDDAIKLMKEYWGKMISLGADTYWEAFEPEQPNFSPYGNAMVNSFCHAWSCTPVWLLHEYLN